MKPSVGRIVHYVSYGTPGGEYKSQCIAAIIAAIPGVGDDVLDLVVFNPAGTLFNRCEYDEGGIGETLGAPTARSYRGGTWHWPERVSK
jgi:hypothetical protein